MNQNLLPGNPTRLVVASIGSWLGFVAQKAWDTTRPEEDGLEFRFKELPPAALPRAISDLSLRSPKIVLFYDNIL